MDRGQTMTTLFTKRSDFQSWRDLIPKDRTIGFVPTMGALHAGHVSLIEHAKSECDVVVVSIYVNDLQFSAESDFTRYPRTEESDFHLCANEQVHAVFAPARSEVFPEEVINVLTPSNNALGFEGTDRQGHFAGVVTVVDRLFSIVRPSVAYFGLKDYQQVAVIRDMALQLHPDIVIESCETVRDADGLALSSRNRFLSVSGRNTATLMNIAFDKAIAIWKSGTTRSKELINAVAAELSQDSAIHVQYISVVRNGTMEPVSVACQGDVIIAAIVVDGVRLIDNKPLINA